MALYGSRNVSFTIAVSGKGGVGKTTFTGMNLNEVLGIEVKSTIGEAREMMKKDVPAGMTKDVWFEYKVQESLTEGKGFDLLAMGRPEGAGCYCAANTLARKSLDLLTENYRYIVIDNEAGMEHFSRLTTRDVDLLFILSDSSRRGILTAARIRDLIRELKLTIHREVLVVNRVPGELDTDMLDEIKRQNLELGGAIPQDEEIYRYDLAGKPTFDLPETSPAVQEARRILDSVIH
jgi:CO dehydrogenase maturation factor